MTPALRRLLRDVLPLRRELGLALLLGSLAVGAGVALMATSGYLISRAALRPPILSLTVAIVAVRLFGVSRGVFRYLERLSSHDAALRLLARLRVRFFEQLEPLVPGGLPAGARTADLLGRFVGDVDDLQHVVVRALLPAGVAVLVGGGSVAAAIGFDLPAGLALAAALAAGALVAPAVGRIGRAAARRQAPARGRLLADVVDLLDAAPELAVAGREREALAAVARSDDRLRRMRGRSALAESTGDALVTLIAGAALVAVVVAAAPSAHTGRLDAVLVGALALLALSAFEAIRPLPLAAQHLASAGAAATRIVEVVERPAPVGDPERPARPPRGGAIRLDDVHVRLRPDGPPVLDGASLALRAGEAVALVGPSGAGKTTIAQLLVRFRDPDRGRVFLDGRDLRTYRQHDVRDAVLLSDQDAHLFATTVRENLRLARPDASDDDLRRALDRARVLEWVDSLPDGFDTFVGDQGELVSGGQRQRLALARAFLSTARLLVFDEPTAHLDRATAAGVVDTILELARDGRGVLLITHDPEAAARFDRVVRLEAGRVAGPGPAR